MKILIIKLGALGDVLRTTPLLRALKAKHPKAQITWIVDAPNREVLANNTLIDLLLDSTVETTRWLKDQVFDLAVNLDKEPEATGFLACANAAKKMGFARDLSGQLGPADELSEYAFRLGIDDELKFRVNQKTYQAISFEQLGLVFQNEEYIFAVDEESDKEIERYLKTLGVPEGRSKTVIGINTGSGTRFAGKKLPIETYARLSEMIVRRMNATVFLLGGKDEIERNEEIQKISEVPVIHTGSHSIKKFAAIVKRCDAVVTGDTTAMHIAIAVRVPVLAYFASTCAAEIEMYGRGRKIVSTISCAPCYKKVCPIDEQCMKDIPAEQLFGELQELMSQNARHLS